MTSIYLTVACLRIRIRVYSLLTDANDILDFTDPSATSVGSPIQPPQPAPALRSHDNHPRRMYSASHLARRASHCDPGPTESKMRIQFSPIHPITAHCAPLISPPHSHRSLDEVRSDLAGYSARRAMAQARVPGDVRFHSYPVHTRIRHTASSSIVHFSTRIIPSHSSIRSLAFILDSLNAADRASSHRALPAGRGPVWARPRNASGVPRHARTNDVGTTRFVGDRILPRRLRCRYSLFHVFA